MILGLRREYLNIMGVGYAPTFKTLLYELPFELDYGNILSEEFNKLSNKYMYSIGVIDLNDLNQLQFNPCVMFEPTIHRMKIDLDKRIPVNELK